MADHYVRFSEMTWPRPDTGACDRRGYGRPGYAIGLYPSGQPMTKRYYAHRRSYEIHKGQIPVGMLVLHKCDNPPCCNPDHLFLGDDASNRADCVAKRRHAHGESNSRARLTEQQALEILRDFRAENKRKTNMRELASKYGVATVTVQALVTGRSWKHLHAK